MMGRRGTDEVAAMRGGEAMFGDGPPPVMRGDLFALLDPESGDGNRSRRATSPEGIARAAQRLVERVRAGERTSGSPVVMQCLDELASLESGAPVKAFSTLSTIRQRLRTLGLATSRGLPGRLVEQRTLVLPQSKKAAVLRVLPAVDHKVWYVATREAFATPASASGLGKDPFGELARPELLDVAMGPAHYDRPEVTFRLYRFGEGAADIRLCMRVIQEPGSYAPVQVAGDGRRVAMLSKDVIGVFDGEGRPVLSGRLPLGEGGKGPTEVGAMALDNDVLGLTLRGRQEQASELALVSIGERRGFPVGKVGEEADHLVLGSRQAYVLDGLQLIRFPLFSGGELTTFSFRPWFAEYPWSPRHPMGWDGERLWISNGRKLVVLSDGLDQVLGEIVLPAPIIDFAVAGREVWLVHQDVQAGRLEVARWMLG